MVELLRKKGLSLSPEEATLLALGIYEDTGSLIFASTTPRDLQAAAWLLEPGANLNIVADAIARDLTPEQVRLLNDLLRSLRRKVIPRRRGRRSRPRRAPAMSAISLAGKLRDGEPGAVRRGAHGRAVLRRRAQPRRARSTPARWRRLGGGGHPQRPRRRCGNRGSRPSSAGCSRPCTTRSCRRDWPGRS
jgi:hypothetical protein